MSTEQNKAVTRRYFEELWTQNNVAVIDEIIAPDVVGRVAGQTFRNADTLRKRAGNLRAIYSDVRFSVEDQIAEGDKVLVRWTFLGRHTGKYLGAEPTGREVTSTGMNLFRLAGGRIAELWIESDDLGELQQLGVVTLPK
jgi:predicted ester cyclase